MDEGGGEGERRLIDLRLASPQVKKDKLDESNTYVVIGISILFLEPLTNFEPFFLAAPCDAFIRRRSEDGSVPISRLPSHSIASRPASDPPFKRATSPETVAAEPNFVPLYTEIPNSLNDY